jgi:hypothetical protein
MIESLAKTPVAQWVSSRRPMTPLGSQFGAKHHGDERLPPVFIVGAESLQADIRAADEVDMKVRIRRMDIV